MHRVMLKSKIHRATVTGSDLNYVGSITVDPDLLDASNTLEHEQVHVVDVELVHTRDTIIIISYGLYSSSDLEDYAPVRDTKQAGAARLSPGGVAAATAVRRPS